ncbi:hypothetical protein J6590_030452 [Homalodisca vitripennis]|nr:hypothetical protein J6590_030452 [Homalodisca vitripennis]
MREGECTMTPRLVVALSLFGRYCLMLPCGKRWKCFRDQSDECGQVCDDLNHESSNISGWFHCRVTVTIVDWRDFSLAASHCGVLFSELPRFALHQDEVVFFRGSWTCAHHPSPDLRLVAVNRQHRLAVSATTLHTGLWTGTSHIAFSTPDIQFPDL